MSQRTDDVDIDEMTVTLTSSRYPRKLMDYLKSKKEMSVETVDNGIYYIKGTDVKTQK